MIAVVAGITIIVGIILFAFAVIEGARHSRSYIGYLIGFIVCLMILGICVVITPGSDTEDTETPVSTEETQTEETVIYEDEIFKATSLGFSDSFGYWCFVVELENKTDQTITVYPSDSSVDDEMVTFTSGTPATMRPGKKFTQSWILNGEPQEQVEFVLTAYDENMEKLVETDLITVEK